MKTTIVLLLVLTLTSCEGFKILSIQNATSANATVIVKPGIDNYETRKLTNYPSMSMADSTCRVLEPDSSMFLMSNFTFLLFNSKIKEHELNTDYLRIETANDTIVANSKAEIIDLLYKRSDKGVKSKGRNILFLKVVEEK